MKHQACLKLNFNFLKIFLALSLTTTLFACGSQVKDDSHKSESGGQWSKAKAHAWYNKQPWLVGTNFGPSNAINQLEMWQDDTFDPETIEKELALSASIGMNTHRIFLHDLLWEQDSKGLIKKLDLVLDLCAKHKIKPMIVFFDGVWDPVPELGKQRAPVPHKHNSGWVQSPGAAALADKSTYPRLKRYVQGIMEHFKNDERILIWDLFNEPENENLPRYEATELKDKYDRAFDLTRASFAWAREVNPSQPITSAVWGGFIGRDGLQPEKLTGISKFMLENSDIVTFHTYQQPHVAPLQIEFLKQYGRPIMCTEYLARSRNNTFEEMLPLFKEHNIGAYNWGLVSGKTNTIYHWDSWDKKYTAEPDLWHHDIFRGNYSPYRTGEVKLIKSLLKDNKSY